MPTPAEFDRLRVVLVNTRNPLNIGAAARAMSNFGVLRLRVVAPYERAFRQAVSAVGGAPVLTSAEECTNVVEAVADCTLVVGTTAIGHRDLQHPLKRLEEGARLIRQHLAGGNVALLFGSEKFGLSNDDLAHCHWLLHIPTREEHTSMNLGQAVAVSLYELVRDPTVQSLSDDEPPATAEDIERISTSLLEALAISGYELPGSAAVIERKVRRLLRRLNFRKTDVDLWLGMLRQILWKLKNGGTSKPKPAPRRAAPKKKKP